MDLLDRALDKGVVVSADLVVSVAGVPLVGVNLRAAVAGMETMLRYGLMRDWDERIRDWESEHVEQREPALLANETTVLRMYGALWAAHGIYRAWKPGHIYLTNRRLILFRAQPAETLREMPLHSVSGYAVRTETHFTGRQRDLVYLALRSGGSVCFYAERHEELLLGDGNGDEQHGHPARRRGRFRLRRARWRGGGAHGGGGDQGREQDVAPGSQVGILGDTWRPGRLYLTEQPARLVV